MIHNLVILCDSFKYNQKAALANTYGW